MIWPLISKNKLSRKIISTAGRIFSFQCESHFLDGCGFGVRKKMKKYRPRPPSQSRSRQPEKPVNHDQPDLQDLLEQPSLPNLPERQKTKYYQPEVSLITLDIVFITFFQTALLFPRNLQGFFPGVIWTHVSRVAPDWDLWRMIYQLSYSQAAITREAV